MNKIKTSASAFAKDLRVSVDSIRKKWPDLGPDGTPFDRHAVLNGSTWTPFLEHFRDSPRASDHTKARAAELLGNTYTVPVSPETPALDQVDQTPDKKPVPAPKAARGGKPRSWERYSNKSAKKDKTDNGVEIRWPVIALVLAPALIWQMEHYATVVDRYSQIVDPVASYVFSWFFAFSVTGTAIVMTAAKGRLMYLYIFAAVETVANILYYLPDTGIKWGTSILLSGAMAFTIFCYSEIFANTFNRK